MDPLILNRPEEGLKPTIPQKAAGIRILPATSDPTAMGTHFMATRLASPPDDPPGTLFKSQGLPGRRVDVYKLYYSCIKYNE